MRMSIILTTWLIAGAASFAQEGRILAIELPAVAFSELRVPIPVELSLAVDPDGKVSRGGARSRLLGALPLAVDVGDLRVVGDAVAGEIRLREPGSVEKGRPVPGRSGSSTLKLTLGKDGTITGPEGVTGRPACPRRDSLNWRCTPVVQPTSGRTRSSDCVSRRVG